MPVLRRGRRGRKIAETCDISPKSEVSSLNDVLNQTIDEFVQDVEEEEQMDKQGEPTDSTPPLNPLILVSLIGII